MQPGNKRTSMAQGGRVSLPDRSEVAVMEEEETAIASLFCTLSTLTQWTRRSPCQGGFRHSYRSETMGYLTWLCPSEQQTSLRTSPAHHSSTSTLSHILPVTPSPSSATSLLPSPVSTLQPSSTLRSIINTFDPISTHSLLHPLPPLHSEVAVAEDRSPGLGDTSCAVTVLALGCSAVLDGKFSHLLLEKQLKKTTT